MTKFNAFRPTLNDLEGRSLMSATFGAVPAEPVLLRVELENVFVSSAQPAPAAADHKETIEIHSWSFGTSDPTAVGSSGMSAGKVAYSDLSVFVGDQTSYLTYKLKDVVISSAQPAPQGERGIVIHTANAYELENVIVSGVQVDTAGGYYQQYLGRQTDANGVEFQDNVRTARELGSRAG